MDNTPAWLPDLMPLSDYGGDWGKYINAVFAVFYKDFIVSQPKFNACSVQCRRDPMYDGKEAGFWHCVSGGANEQNRIPDMRRCEAIGWIRAIIENCNDSLIKVWKSKKKSDVRVYLWFNEKYLVVVGERKKYLQLITAFNTDRDHTVRKLQREYERSINS